MQELDEFTESYVQCMLYSETADDVNKKSYMDCGFTVKDISEATLLQIIIDCKKFQGDNYEYIVSNIYLAAYDFWLTRNGHGAGFWGEDWDFTINGFEVGKLLTQESKKFGAFEIYLGDDGKIYH